MTPTQIEHVQSSWEQVVPIAKDAASLFYDRLFTIAPHTRTLFGSDIDEQGKKLMTILTTVVRGLKNFEKLEVTVWQLGRRHAVYQVTEKDFQPVAEALLWTLEQGLGGAFTNEVKESWVAAYTALAGVMSGGMQSQYANFDVWKAEQTSV